MVNISALLKTKMMKFNIDHKIIPKLDKYEW